MSYETAARRAKGTTMTARLEESREDHRENIRSTISYQVAAQLTDPNAVAAMLDHLRGFAQENDRLDLLDEYPVFKLDLSSHHFQAVTNQLRNLAGEIPADDSIVETQLEQEELL